MNESYTKPFRGILYNKEKIDDIGTCVCPPYDVISSDKIYLEKSPFNAIRLELPAPLPDADKYTNALRTFEDWYGKGILAIDERDTVYIYEQEFDVEEISYLRRGFIALNKLDKNRILTHEQTRKKAKEDREMLITTLKTLTSLVFALYEDKDQEIEKILAGSQREMVYDFVDEQSIRNRFYRMTKDDEINHLMALMDERKIYIADGHHRLDVSYKLNIPYIPLYLTNMYSEGIVILPYHRLIKFDKPGTLPQMLDLLQHGHIDIVKFPFSDQKSIKMVLHTIAASSIPSFALYSKDDLDNLYLLTVPKPLPTFSGNGPLERLKVNVLHTGILKEILHFMEEEISFTQDPQGLIRSVQEGIADCAFLLPPTTTGEVKEVADNGLDMPPKSTFFYPKILTGLLFHKYA
ncbi:MAG: hypothetical protein C0392_10580 [Syntrophus sp. (in: bacteria)]|nr:hypothetical protein [Syntrophus sp. (in: bacteria)]